jgi:hypothetical protein
MQAGLGHYNNKCSLCILEQAVIELKITLEGANVIYKHDVRKVLVMLRKSAITATI